MHGLMHIQLQFLNKQGEKMSDFIKGFLTGSSMTASFISIIMIIGGILGWW